MNFAMDNEWDLSISEFTFNAIRVIYNNQNRETEPISGEFKTTLFNEAASTITIDNSKIIGSKLTLDGKPISHKVPERRPFQYFNDAANFMLSTKNDYDCVSLSIYEENSLNGVGTRTIYVVEYENKDENGCCWYDIDCINYYNNHH